MNYNYMYMKYMRKRRTNRIRRERTKRRARTKRRYSFKGGDKINDILSLFVHSDRLMSSSDLADMASIIEKKIDFSTILCRPHLLSYLFKEIVKQFDTNNKNDFDFYTNMLYTKEFPVIILYYQQLNVYFNDGYTVFSLGDSLDKLNTFWNIKNLSRQITTIPFSGSMFDEQLNLDENTKRKMITQYSNLLNNNHQFAQLIYALNNGQRVVITDFLNTGKSYLTLLELFSHFHVNIDSLYFLYITYNDDIDSHYFLTRSATYHYTHPIQLIWVPDDADAGILSFYFTNSETSHSRCVPKYTVNDWKNPVSDIFYNKINGQYNYKNCNLHTLLFYMAMVCFYLKMFEKKNEID